MSVLAGILSLADSQRAYVNDIGHGLVFDAVNTSLEYHNAEVNAMLSLFVERDIVEHQTRYMLPIGGMSQPGTEMATPANVRRYNVWDCAFPLRSWVDAVGWSRVGLGYLTIQEVEATVQGIKQRDWARIRQRLLIAIMENTNLAWTDPLYGALTIRRLANTDGSLFAPIAGSDVDADDLHYLDAAFAEDGITDANNPIVDLRDEIVEHFGGRGTRGENIVYIHSDLSTADIAGLTGYTAVSDLGIDYGDDTSLAKIVSGLPGRVHGRVNGCWVSEWVWMPDEYAIAVHMDYPPLLRRVDPSFTGLGTGLQMVAVMPDHPLESSSFENRYGFAVGNRVSAACIEINSGGGTYTPPAAYAE